MKYRITLAASFLYDIGVSFHATGTIKKGKAALYDYYKTDKVTEEQKEKILSWCKDAAFFNTAWEYAPELKGIAIAFPKAGFYRQEKVA